ncbi:TnsA endonuclease N-terminal domain-containing protein [Sphingomonas sp. Leaf33]|uniref:TnsA endonuclease N-terminal domain-containing protein n=1 Tax=Sphingomonas sp. Leaf33 TaxID=1736215 RepID=UPI000ACA42EB|nr:TnsA endonuclease N-terminal domain-containing protein [Sphingomonas sp. Leaf33]
MQKRNRTQTRAVMENRARQGRGRGEGVGYTPWLFVHDVASRGRSSRIASGGRVIHTLSDWETAAYRDFQWDPAVEDIQEQYPLPIEDTLRIAAEMRISHPADGRPREPIVVTSDLVVTRREDGKAVRLARAIKEKSAIDLGAARNRRERVKIGRTLQKLELERRYWAERGVDWFLLTDQHLSKVRKVNIEFMLGVRPDPDRPTGHWRTACGIVHEAIAGGGRRTLDAIARGLDADGTLARRDFPTCVRLLCARRALAFDMDRKFELSRPASDFVVAATNSEAA